MAPKIYEIYYKKFISYVNSETNINGNVRELSKMFATEIRGGTYDLYARKYHAFLFTKWCDDNGIAYPDDWNPEGFWPGNFA